MKKRKPCGAEKKRRRKARLAALHPDPTLSSEAASSASKTDTSAGSWVASSPPKEVPGVSGGVEGDSVGPKGPRGSDSTPPETYRGPKKARTLQPPVSYRDAATADRRLAIVPAHSPEATLDQRGPRGLRASGDRDHSPHPHDPSSHSPCPFPHPIPPAIEANRVRPAVPIAAGRTKFSQINLQHCKAASAVLSRDLARLQTDIVLIQEPWVYRGQVKGISMEQGSLIHANEELGPRAYVFVNRTHSAIKLSQFCTRDLAVATIKLCVEGRITELVIASAYLPYDSDGPPPTRELRELVDYCSNKGADLLVGCDANSHHTVWASSDTNERRTALLEYICLTNLEILNRGSKPTFVTPRRQEVIDLTLGSPRVCQAVVNWMVSDEDTLSDHRLINFELLGRSCQAPVELRRNPRKANWPTFKVELEGLIGNLRDWPRTGGGIEREAGELQTASIHAFEAACPIRERRVNKKVAWWSAELNKLRKCSRRLLNRALRSRQDLDWAAYKEAQRAYKKLVKKSKA